MNASTQSQSRGGSDGSSLPRLLFRLGMLNPYNNDQDRQLTLLLGQYNHLNRHAGSH